YRALMDALRQKGLIEPGALQQPSLPSVAWLKLAHEPDYVDQVLARSVPDEIERGIGFAVGELVLRRAQLATAGTLLAARLALDQGIACNTAGGSHHARRSQGAGFCTFNDVAVATAVLLAEGSVGSVL